MTFYGYDRCGTCRKAKAFLNERDVEFDFIDITLNPPPLRLLRNCIQKGGYTIKELFNTSGQVYRELNLKEKIKTHSEKDLLEMLSDNGRLVKRPFIESEKGYAVGFDPERLEKLL